MQNLIKAPSCQFHSTAADVVTRVSLFAFKAEKERDSAYLLLHPSVALMFAHTHASSHSEMPERPVEINTFVI